MATTLRRPRTLVLVLLLSVVVGCSGADGAQTGGTRDPTSAGQTTTETPASPEELAVEAAIAAVVELKLVLDAALQDPAGRDWEPEIRQVAGDPYASLAIDGIRTYATGGIKQVGETSVEDPAITDVDMAASGGPTVLLTGCYDSSESDVVRVDNGESIFTANEPKRFVWNLTVTQPPPGESWLVSVLVPHPDQPC